MTNMPVHHRPDFYELVEDLTTTTTNREAFIQRRGGTTWTSHHVTTVPSLIVQLGDVTPVSSGEAGFGGFGSRPAALLEAIDTLVHIDLAAARWVRDLGEDDPGDELEVIARHSAPIGPACVRCTHPSCVRIRRGEIVERRAIPGSGTTSCVRKLRALHASAHRCRRRTAHRDNKREVDCCTQHAIEADVYQWWLQARIVTGWDSAAWRPDSTCPLCEKRGTLRIKLASGFGMCIECRGTWDAESIGLLADHIRTENAELIDAS